MTLLQALSVHTHPGHPDHTHLSSALDTLLRFREFVQKVQRPHRASSLLFKSVFSDVNKTQMFFFLFVVKTQLGERQSDGGDAADDPRMSGKNTAPSSSLCANKLTQTYTLKCFNMNHGVCFLCVQSLSESNRQLIITQDAALLRSPDEQIPDSFR